MKRSLKMICAGAAAVLMLTAASGANAAAAAESPQNKAYETTDTLFGIGSVSKMFVTAAAMQLADQGLIDRDAPVTDYLPEFTMTDSRYRDITVRMLMNHRSGLMGSYYSNDILLGGRSTVQHDNFLQYLSTERLKAAPGAYGAYCNDGFELLEQIVERVSGERFTDYVENRICKPLGLQQTGTPWNAFQTAEQTPVFRSRTELVPDYCMTIGTGGILATASELCTFGSAFFTGNSVLLSEEAKAEISARADNDIYEDGFGLGWDKVGNPDYDAAGVKVVSKGGDLMFQHAELLIAPDEQISVAVTSAGGSSTSDTQLAMALMDIALEEKGITVTHSAPEILPTQDTVPEEYLKNAGYYLSGGALVQLSFPQSKYMEVECLSDPRQDVLRYLYTGDGSFVEVYGNAAEGKAVQRTDEQTILRFAERDGSLFLTEESISGDSLRGFIHSPAVYSAQKVSENPLSDAVQAAWNERTGKRYYLCSESASSASYTESFVRTVSVQAAGFISDLKITDSNHAETVLQIPSSASRDQTDMEFYTKNGKEYMSLTAMGSVYLAEDAMPDLPSGLTSAELTTGEAVWYNIGSDANRTVKLDIPKNASVFVYDKRDRMIYSSFMKDYGESVPLPANGKIVFIGETGSAVGLQQN